MSEQDQPPYPFPSDKDELLRDFTVASKLREIRDSADLRYSLAPKWWETLIGVLQFGAALGLLASLVQHPTLRADPLLRLIVFWGALTLLSLVLGFEFMILKLYHLRRANELALRELEEMDKRMRAVEKRTGERKGPLSPAASENREP